MTGGAVSRCREAGDGRDLLADGGGAGAGDRVAQILNSKSSKGTLLQFDGEAVEAAEVKHTTEMLLMRGQKVAENQYIVKIDKTKRKLTKDPVHHPMEGLGSVLEAKREAEKIEKAEESDEGGLRNICRPLRNLEIILLEFKFGEEL